MAKLIIRDNNVQGPHVYVITYHDGLFHMVQPFYETFDKAMKKVPNYVNMPWVNSVTVERVKVE